MDDQKRKDASKVTLGGAAAGQNRAVNSVDTLYQLFLNILLRPREWTA
jgi:protein phosphatase